MSVKPTGWEDESKVLPGMNMLTTLFIRGKCTKDKAPDLFDVFQKVLTDTINLDDSQTILRNSLKSSLNSKKSKVVSRGHSYDNRRIRGRYAVPCTCTISKLIAQMYQLLIIIIIFSVHWQNYVWSL